MTTVSTNTTQDPNNPLINLMEFDRGNLFGEILAWTQGERIVGVCQKWDEKQNALTGFIVSELQKSTGLQVFDRPSSVTPKDLKEKYQQLPPEELKKLPAKSPFRILDLIKVMHPTIQKNKDEALLALWEEIAPDELKGVQDVNAIRSWMKDPFNKEYLDSIWRLRLCGKKLKCIPPEIQYLTRLTHLDLGFNEIEVIPPEIQHLTQLRTLYLSNNQIQVIPSEFQHLTCLRYLDLSKNKIRVIPSEFQYLTGLERLSLQGNQIQVIPPEIGCLTRLLILNISDNQIQVIPPEIQHLTRLREFMFWNNQIQFIPREIEKLTELSDFYFEKSLEGNRIDAISRNLWHYTNSQRAVSSMSRFSSMVLHYPNKAMSFATQAFSSLGKRKRSAFEN